MLAICAPGGLFPEAMNLMPSSQFQVLEDWSAEARARSVAWLIRAPHTVDLQILENSPLLRLIVMQGTGVDHIDEIACKTRNIKVQNTPGVNANAAAEWTMLVLLALSRNFLESIKGSKAQKWEREKWMGNELSEKTLGLVGLGNVGRNVAKKAQAFGMSVFAFDPFVEPATFLSHGVKAVSRDELFRTSDVISLHLPLNSETCASVGQKEFSSMKKSAYFLNTARGELIDENALLGALSENLAGAALDVFSEEPLPASHPFASHPKIICSPHMAGQSKKARLEIQMQACEKVLKFFNTRKGI